MGREGYANSPLGIYLGIDFELVGVQLKPSDLWHRLNAHTPQQANAQTLLQQSELYINMIEEVQMTLQAVKPPGREAR